MKDKQYGLVEVKVNKDEENRVIEFVATDQIVDYDSDIVEVDGMDISKIKKNKSFLWSHQGSQPPIGKIMSLKKVGKKILGKAQLTSEEEYPFGYQIYKLIKGGYINNVSISFMPDYDTIEYKEVKGKRVQVIKNATMLEVSAVNIGANRNAMITGKSLKDIGNKAWDDGVIDGEELNALNDSIDKIEVAEDTGGRKEVGKEPTVTKIGGAEITTGTLVYVDKEELDGYTNEINKLQAQVSMLSAELKFIHLEKEIDEEAELNVYDELYHEFMDDSEDNDDGKTSLEDMLDDYI